MLLKNDILDNVSIEKIVFKGLGIAYYDGHTIFVYKGVPGDKVSIKIIHKRGDSYFGEIVSYIQKSDWQIEVNCSVFDKCGGCDWLHIPYHKQLEIKEQIVGEYFGYSGKVQAIVPSPQELHYRNKIFLPVTTEAGVLTTGLYARRSHDIIPQTDCLLQPGKSKEILEKALYLLNKSKVTHYDEVTGKGLLRFIGIRYSEMQQKYLLVLVTRSSKLPFANIFVKQMTEEFELAGIVQNINKSPFNRILGNNEKILYGEDSLCESINGVSFKIHYSSFFQVNTGIASLLLEQIKAIVKPADTVIDAYSGIGTFGVYIADKVSKVVLLEEHSQSVTDGKLNIETNKRTNCTFITGQVENILPKTLRKENTIIFDPPRKGLESSTINILKKSEIRKIIYLSCDISTQKRDIELLEKFGFKLTLIKPFDMFPQTYHIENLAVLER